MIAAGLAVLDADVDINIEETQTIESNSDPVFGGNGEFTSFSDYELEDSLSFDEDELFTTLGVRYEFTSNTALELQWKRYFNVPNSYTFYNNWIITDSSFVPTVGGEPETVVFSDDEIDNFSVALMYRF